MRMDYFSDLVAQEIDGAQAEITSEGSKFDARVISDAFEGLSTLNRHKMVYAVLNEHIKSGAIHALSIKTYTSEEWKATSTT